MAIKFLTILLSSFLPCSMAMNNTGFILPVIHKYSPLSPYFNTIKDSYDGIISPISYDTGTYLMPIHIGSCLVKRYASIDTGSDLVWINCKPCNSCPEKENPPFDETTSLTYQRFPCLSLVCTKEEDFSCSDNRFCNFRRTYQDDTEVKGELGIDIVLIPLANEPKFANLSFFAFGCAHYSNGSYNRQTEDGLLGLGRGTLSFINQLKAERFSHCFPPLYRNDGRGEMKFGSNAELIGGRTPMLDVPGRQFNYFVKLQGISVGDVRLDLPDRYFDLRSDGNGGFIIDSGTALSTLSDYAYYSMLPMLDKAIGVERVKQNMYPYRTCYWATERQTRRVRLTYHFAEVDIPFHSSGVFTNLNSYIMCLSINPNGDSGPSVLGALGQTDLNIGYDLTGKFIFMKPRLC